MLPPFLRLRQCTSAGHEKLKIILAASGPVLYCFNAFDGRLLSRWSYLSPSAIQLSPADDGESEPLAKRRRLSGGDSEVSDASSAEIVINNDQAEKPRRRKRKAPAVPSIVKFCVTSSGGHVVVVTGEDKKVRVLRLSDGHLDQISERQMPKKPSAIAFTPDQKSVLVADKFGDVYALPLIIDPNSTDSSLRTDAVTKPDEDPVMFKPAASSMTVHTKKNLQALQNQLTSRQVYQKKTIEFDHQLVLGHVSLLTDILCQSHRVNGHLRNYIITADRDEHIRVSRGIPQAYVIEQYCLGHTNFITKLLVPSTNPKILVSGGGDDDLIVWDWAAGQIITRIPFGRSARQIQEGAVAQKPDSEQQCSGKVAVSGLWSMQLPTDGAPNTAIVVACEGLPALLTYLIDVNNRVSEARAVELEGNPLDILVDQEQFSILVAIDSAHEAGSMSQLRAPPKGPHAVAFSWSSENSRWENEGPLANVGRSINEFMYTRPGEKEEVDFGCLSDLFYGAEHLRKRVTEESRGEQAKISVHAD